MDPSLLHARSARTTWARSVPGQRRFVAISLLGRAKGLLYFSLGTQPADGSCQPVSSVVASKGLLYSTRIRSHNEPSLSLSARHKLKRKTHIKPASSRSEPSLNLRGEHTHSFSSRTVTHTRARHKHTHSHTTHKRAIYNKPQAQYIVRGLQRTSLALRTRKSRHGRAKGGPPRTFAASN